MEKLSTEFFLAIAMEFFSEEVVFKESVVWDAFVVQAKEGYFFINNLKIFHELHLHLLLHTIRMDALLVTL